MEKFGRRMITRCSSGVREAPRIAISKNADTAKGRGQNVTRRPIRDLERWHLRKGIKQAANLPKRYRRNARKRADTRRVHGASAMPRARWQEMTSWKWTATRPAIRTGKSRRSARQKVPSQRKLLAATGSREETNFRLQSFWILFHLKIVLHQLYMNSWPPFSTFHTKLAADKG